MTGYVPLKRVARIRYGLGQPPPLSEEGVPIIRATNVSRGKISANNLLRARLEDLPLDRAPLLHEGEILVVRSGAYTGDSARITSEWTASAPGYDLRVTPQTVDSRFAAHALLSTAVLDQISLASTRAAQPHLNAEELGEVKLWLPPLEEQRRIADFLDAETARIDQLVLKRRQMRSLLTLKRERVIESTLGLERAQTTDGLVPLKYLVADVTVGIVITPAKWYVEAGGTPALRGLNVKPGFISTGDLVQISAEGHAENRKSRLNTGDVVVVRTGQAGAAAVVPAELDGANCIDLIVVRPGRKTSPRYLQYVLNSDYASARVTEHSVGSIQAHFNVGAMKQIPIPSIPRTEQDEIVRLLDIRVGALDQLHRKLDHQEQLLTERRQALITAAVTGQFDVSTASGRNVTDGVAA
ncbi:restriction endonuclease subunit S [Streptomyces sp. B21-083]|uniref:restriction endonuclease subunit S n=1 Tax=Streptomyces sp. B21-083 TaxID=3039410 RepID=UPI002FF2BB0F